MIKFSREDNVAIENLIEACDLTAKTNARAKTLSGGQKRKLQLACTFIGGSSVCLLDEVTSGLVRTIWVTYRQLLT
jgi:ATP-binding cassette subfamily A (ABC1) protein 3